MNQRGLKLLEYNKIIELLKSQAGSPMAKESLGKLLPLKDKELIEERLKETSEAVDVIVKKGNLPIGQLYDINDSLHFAKKGGSLSMRQLLQILYNMRVTQDILGFLKNDVPPIPIIREMTELLEVFPKLCDRIDKSILSEDEMADTASAELKNIRREILRQNEAIRVKLNSMIGAQSNKTYLQDAIVTMRDGRYVVPVKAEHRSKIAGIVHDQSGSGQTLFIEPQVIVDLNNSLRELEIAERVEIERILAELSSNVAEHFKALINNQKLLVKLDIIFAKGKLSVKMSGERPEINDEGFLKLRKARHPLIDKKKVVPIDIHIGDEYGTLVITGPNTGGKTVTLKTVGLLCMMSQSGLHIPASSMSQLPIYEDIFADIGDEQSIEQSLSTFSSHMKNTVDLVNKAKSKTLVLLDELGAGTDPTEGAALAIAILEKLSENGATTIATTHYNELKKYALSTDNVENASMEFDVETLSPTYRLSIGIPGKSNAFEISKKLGLSGTIIDRAVQLIENRDMEFEEVISTIEEDKRKAEAERDEARAITAKLQEEEKAMKRRLELLEKHEREVLSKAKEDARAIIKEARETANEVQEDLKKLSKVESLGERNNRLAKGKGRLTEIENKYAETLVREVNDKPVSAKDIKVGDKVKLLTLGQNGEVLTKPDSEGQVQIQVGVIKMYVKVQDLMLINQGPGKKARPKTSKYSQGSLFRKKAMDISISINVIGENLSDAIYRVDKYLDDAYLAGLKEVTIVHGRGAGILQKGLRDMLKSHHLVASHKRGEFNEGGDGVTVVKLKG